MTLLLNPIPALDEGGSSCFLARLHSPFDSERVASLAISVAVCGIGGAHAHELGEAETYALATTVLMTGETLTFVAGRARSTAVRLVAVVPVMPATIAARGH